MAPVPDPITTLDRILQDLKSQTTGNTKARDAAQKLMDFYNHLDREAELTKKQLADSRTLYARLSLQHAETERQLKDANQEIVKLKLSAGVASQDGPGVLVKQLDQIPSDVVPLSLRTFIENLKILLQRRADLDWFETGDGLDQLDSFVYQPPPSLARLRLEMPSASPAEMKLALHQILELQNLMHDALAQIGIEPINPSQGTRFEGRLHNANDAEDDIWVQDPALHNTIVAVKRLGYRYRRGDRVMRMAQVKRRLYSEQLPDPLQTSQNRSNLPTAEQLLPPGVTFSIPQETGTTSKRVEIQPASTIAEPASLPVALPTVTLNDDVSDLFDDVK